MPDNLPPDGRYAPTHLDDKPEIAGAVEHVDPRQGLQGWVVKPATPRRPIPLVVMCAGQVVGYSYAALRRPDIDQAMNVETRSGFSIGWHRLDGDKLGVIAASTPDAPIALKVSGTDYWIRATGTQPTAADAVAMIHAARLQPVETNDTDALTDLFAAPAFDHRWYASNVMRRRAARAECLLHYIERGEEAGERPNADFDPEEVMQQLGVTTRKGLLLASLKQAAEAQAAAEAAPEPPPPETSPQPPAPPAAAPGPVPQYAPSRLEDMPPIAALMDLVDPERGLVGWAVMPHAPLCPVALVVKCDDHILGYDFAANSRPDIDHLIGAEARAGFAVGWHRIDRSALERCVQTIPDALVRLEISGTDLRVRSSSPLPTAAEMLALLERAADQPPHYHTGDAVTDLYPVAQFDHEWYAANVLGREATRAECLLDYIERGEAAGARPNPDFDFAAEMRQLGATATRGVLLASLGLRPLPPQPAPGPGPAAGVSAGLDPVRMREIMARTGNLLDFGSYLAAYPESESDMWGHFITIGDAAWAAPNFYFDPAYYCRTHFTGPPPPHPFRHYVLVGEAAGLNPAPFVDIAWYAGQHSLELGEGAVLSHLLASRGGTPVSPTPYFDIDGYLHRYPDIRKAGIDPFEHYYRWGQQEGRWGSDQFDALFVRDRYLSGDLNANPLCAFLEFGRKLGWNARPDPDAVNVTNVVRRNMAPGPGFELLNPPTERNALPEVKAFAFYLPQFHAIPENDEWWGTGFTEWRNLARGMPRFEGHYQPRCPRDLGHYNLLDGTTMRRQVELARQMGLEGFGFYYYNFNGRRLLEKPLDLFCADPEIDFPFFLIWANENWTRRWDGADQDILLAQDYRLEDQIALVDDLAGYMRHPSYVRMQGRPLMCIYRADIIPDCAVTLQQLREDFRERHGLDPIMIMAQTFHNNDPRPFGFDGAFEFPPHKIGARVHAINHTLNFIADFTGPVIDYADAVKASLDDQTTDFPLIKTAFPTWDNDPRKQGNGGMVFHGSTPAQFADWVRGLANYARSNRVFGEAFVFINAWNEWCEGAYLEPDVHYGYAYINALAQALRPALPPPAERILLVGHDAFPSGAQRLLLHIGRVMVRRFGTQVEFLLLGGGELLEAYQALAPTTIVPTDERLGIATREQALRLRQAGFSKAILNTASTARLAQVLEAEGFHTTSLIHELSTTLVEHSLTTYYETARDYGSAVVFASDYVRNEVEEMMGPAQGQTLVRAQGIFRPFVAAPSDRAEIRAQLGVADDTILVVTVGHADMRKAPDVMLETAEAARAAHLKMHFVWVGGGHPHFMRWIERDRARRGLDNVAFVGPSEEVDRYLAAADVFFLSSREDPFPTVVLEALDAGLPVVAFARSGGHTDLLRDVRLGAIVPYLDSEAAAQALYAQARASTDDIRATRHALMRENFDFADYCAFVCAVGRPARPRISVVVPNYNYGRYMEQRLRSIFTQTFPVFEVIVLDDASTDDSAVTVATVAEAFGRDIEWVANERNSGCVFRQWKAGLDRARGDFVWIAEADDTSGPDFLATLVEAISARPDIVFAFSDSRAIGLDGTTLYEDYKGYYAQNGDHGLDQDAVFETAEFLRRFLYPRNLVLNASAVLWRTEALRATFESLGETAFTFSCAGDWRIYVEACRLPGAIAYVAATVNNHRRHDASVTHVLEKDIHYDEVKRVLDTAEEILGTDSAMMSERGAYLETLQEAWFAAKKPGHRVGNCDEAGLT